MKTARLLLAVSVLLSLSTAVLADGFIVPVHPHPPFPPPPHPRPPHPIPIPPPPPFRGSWAVKHHHVAITVRDQVATVAVDQSFINTGGGNIEVEYFFPVPPTAAIDSLTLVVDGKEMSGKLLKAEEARKIYEDTVRRMKDPALLEYAGFGLYKTQAFPLQAGKPAQVQVTYRNICHKDGKLTEVWYPLATEKYSSKPIESVEITIDIKADADIASIYSPSHEVNKESKGPRQTVVTYKAANVVPATDMQVYYETADKDVGAAMLSHLSADEKDGYFLLLVSPNPRTAATKVSPKDVVLVLDHSGSMGTEKLAQAKEALIYVLKNLNENDRYNVILYEDSVEKFHDDLVAVSKKGIEEDVDRLDVVTARGGTDIYGALTTALTQPKVRQRGKGDRPAYILFLTDGVPTTGKKTIEGEILEDVQRANESKARIFTFGVGYDVNVRLLDKLSEQNAGRSEYAKPKESIGPKIAGLYGKIRNPVMTNLQVKVNNLALRDVYPRKLDDLFEGDQIVLAGRYDGKGAAALPTDKDGKHKAQLAITGTYEGKERGFEYEVTVAAATGGRYDFVEKLWAVRRIGFLLGEIQLHGKSSEVVDEIVRLSLKYGIITPYTSFLAEEKTALSSTRELQHRAAAETNRLLKEDGATGAEAQLAARGRQEMERANRPAGRPDVSAGPAPGGKLGAPAAPSVARGQTEGTALGDSGAVYGYKDKKTFEQGGQNMVNGMRQVNNQAMYQRGRLWIASNAAHLDPERDADKIKTLDRYSEEYFKLVKSNTTEINQLLARQQGDEELLIVMQNQAYRVR